MKLEEESSTYSNIDSNLIKEESYIQSNPGYTKINVITKKVLRVYWI